MVPTGIAAPALLEYQKTGAVTYRVRLPPPPASGWTVVWNVAVLVAPTGIGPEGAGKPGLENLSRVLPLPGWDSPSVGAPFAASAIRELTFESRYGIEHPPMALPDVGLHTRYLEPPGMGELRYQSNMGLLAPDAPGERRRACCAQCDAGSARLGLRDG